MMMMITMKKRPIRKRSQTSTGAAFIDWCFKSRNSLEGGIVQYYRALSAPHPDKELPGMYTLKLVRETDLSNIQRSMHNLEKGNNPVSCDCNSNTFSCEEDLQSRREISMR